MFQEQTEPIDTNGSSLQNREPLPQERTLDTKSEQLLALITQNIHSRRKRAHIVKWIAICFQVPVILYVLVSYLTSWLFSHSLPWASGLMRLSNLTSFFGLVMWWGLRGDNAERLASIATLKSVGALIEIYGIESARYGYDKDTRNAVRASLTYLLPQLKASDSDLINREQRKILYDSLPKEKEQGFLLAILKSLEQVGDGEAAGAVEKMTLTSSKCREDQEVQAAAQALLPHLREVARLEQERRVLVRAADSPGGPEDLLVRPAAGGGNAAPEHLLRPVVSSEPE